MVWILVGLVAGSLVTSQHDTEEACLGRKALLEKQAVSAKCVPLGQTTTHFFTGNNLVLTPGTTVN